MERKIIELAKNDNGYKCLICCAKQATIKIKINRLVCDDSVTSFHVCDECLAKMQKEIETCE